MKEKILRVPHRHVVMTLSHILLDFVRRTSADTLKDWMMHKFGLKTRVIAVLHTYGETKQLHVHTAHDYVMGRHRQRQ